jgi:hypothetical protein
MEAKIQITYSYKSQLHHLTTLEYQSSLNSVELGSRERENMLLSTQDLGRD